MNKLSCIKLHQDEKNPLRKIEIFNFGLSIMAYITQDLEPVFKNPDKITKCTC